MRTIVKKTYICDFCMSAFVDKDDALSCEDACRLLEAQIKEEVRKELKKKDVIKLLVSNSYVDEAMLYAQTIAKENPKFTKKIPIEKQKAFLKKVVETVNQE